MQPHGNLSASCLWQPGELARRMLGERPAPVPPTRDLWPKPEHPMSISTLHVAYLQDEPPPRRASSLQEQPYLPTTVEDDCEYRPRLCTIGTNTDPPPTIFDRLRQIIKKQHIDPVESSPPGRLRIVARDEALEIKDEENAAQRALRGIKKAISGAKCRITPGSESVESPKIVFDTPKPGDRMMTTFGARPRRRWCRVPSRYEIVRRLRELGACCARAPRPPPRRTPQPPLQITQV
ncbi:uncharacterized protein LOC106710524 [Papilio machaon]|uniref:uncharacterized protein LOC106710524 n=1 Tax=Papilio machaon TaxID=76193 RepID=UPI001E665276|nr:uncharacterized protein LOC106710524 [Papilio machaon]